MKLKNSWQTICKNFTRTIVILLANITIVEIFIIKQKNTNNKLISHRNGALLMLVNKNINILIIIFNVYRMFDIFKNQTNFGNNYNRKY